MVDELIESEREKYERMWSLESYGERSPGMRHLDDALSRLMPSPGATIVDLGCGTGRVSAALKAKGFDVTAVDIAANAATEFDGPYVVACLWDLPQSLEQFDYGFCADVMEHIPTARVDDALWNIAIHAQTTYFQIANFICHEGDAIGQHLHLTVKPIGWWEAKLNQFFTIEQSSKQPKHHIFVCKSLAF